MSRKIAKEVLDRIANGVWIGIRGIGVRHYFLPKGRLGDSLCGLCNKKEGVWEEADNEDSNPQNCKRCLQSLNAYKREAKNEG